MKKKILIFSSIFVLIDQVLKILVRSNLKVEIENFIIPKFFYLTYAKNTGGAFSIFSNNTIILALIAVVALYFFIKYLLSKEDITKLEVISYSILLGGIVGNLIDRVVFNYVTDYIGLVFGTYYYPVFNFADIGIVIGIILLFIIEIRSGKDGINSK